MPKNLIIFCANLSRYGISGMIIDPIETLLLVIDMQKDFYASDGNAALRGKPTEQIRALPAKIDDFAATL